mmetsp:Transcript_19619/g.42896  ORF Transcript_19619/g.42896 Transcript_19619/m.42896 type:complete len:661 (+) Transcript_19619:41-2023(+)
MSAGDGSAQDGGAEDPELERQAQAMAEKALAALPEGARAAKIGKVKEGILKSLRARASASGPTVVPAAAGPVPAGAVTGQAVPLLAAGGPVVAPPPVGVAPPPPPPTTEDPPTQKLKLDGIEACGDEAWFADPVVRRALRDSIIAGHAEQKILVGAPADEIRRICPGGGRVLGAGAVLRLGGSTLGGYGEADIGYAFRQLSRALHPDKNPDVPEAPDAFKRLKEAADELREGLVEARTLLGAFVAVMGGTTTPEMLERPQEALFAEASRLLSAVLALSGQGEVPPTALHRGMVAFSASTDYYNCQGQALISEWYDGMRLLDLYASAPLRTAYDCAPKRFRAQFLCALNRAVLAEAKRNSDCVRGNWQAVMMQFPEINLWRDLREKIRVRVFTPDPEPNPQPGGEEERRKSKWDDKSDNKLSSWARLWRKRIRMILPRGTEEALPSTDPQVLQLAAALWNDIVEWARNEDAQRHLELFTAEPVGRSYPSRGIDPGPEPRWAFVPAADVLLVVAEGLLGLTAEGAFAENGPGHEKMTFAEAMNPELAKKRERERERERSRSRRSRGRRDRSRGREDKKVPQNDPDFDWEKVWRSRIQSRKRARSVERAISPLPVSSRDRHRSRSRARRRRTSRSRTRRASPSAEPRRSRSRKREKRERSGAP